VTIPKTTRRHSRASEQTDCNLNHQRINTKGVKKMTVYWLVVLRFYLQHNFRPLFLHHSKWTLTFVRNLPVGTPRFLFLGHKAIKVLSW